MGLRRMYQFVSGVWTALTPPVKWAAVFAAVTLIVAVTFLFSRLQSEPIPIPRAAATPAVPLDVAASAETLTAMKTSGPLAGSPLFGVHAEELAPTGKKYVCADAGQLRQQTSKGLFWQSETAANQFIYFENESRLLVVCDGHNAASTVLKDIGLTSREELVKFDQPHFGDWEHNGKFEFTLFRGQCADGPCIGLFHVFQIDGTKLKELAEINADRVDLEQMSIGGVSRTSLQIQTSCYDMDSEPVFDYVVLLDFGGPNILTLVPPQQIRLRAPELVQRLKEPPALDSDSSVTQAALAQIQAIIAQAYEGKPGVELKRDYLKVLASIPNLKASDPPPLQCDPLSILTMISEGK